jgi:hypothetical protein
MMFQCEYPKAIWSHSKIDRIWKSPHPTTPYIFLNDPPSLRSILDFAEGDLHGVQKLRTETLGALLIKLRRPDKLLFGVGMVGYSHPRARRADLITSS